MNHPVFRSRRLRPSLRTHAFHSGDCVLSARDSTALELYLSRHGEQSTHLRRLIEAKLAMARHGLAGDIEPDRIQTGRSLWLQRDGHAIEGPLRLLNPVPARCPAAAIPLLSATGIAVAGLRTGDYSWIESRDGAPVRVRILRVDDPVTTPASLPEPTPFVSQGDPAMNQTQPCSPTRPPILIGRDQARRLSALADQALDRAPDIGGRLLDELERAELIDDAKLPTDVVAVGREIVFLDESSGRQRSVHLVWPAQADIDQDRISILTAVGTGLIGLRTGAAIDWRVQDGSTRRLRILAVRDSERTDQATASP